ncbi:MAG: hypothetical protein OEV85_13560 [Candidatus Thorarchaeota archaeon]|nr:hypothetical protein [Candidatus Thorarchaeota archaeon]
MAFLPIQRNTVALTTLALIAALGVVARFTLQIPVIPNAVVLTPGFMFSLLGGVVGGLPGGIIVGAIVGASGALSGTELPLLPMFGNICLGIGSGYAVYFAKRDTLKYYAMVLFGGGIIGGFIPTMTVFSSLVDPLIVNLIAATIDMAQAFLWAFAALIVESKIIRPILGHYLYSEGRIEELGERDG